MTSRIEVTVRLDSILGSGKAESKKVTLGQAAIDINTVQIMSGDFDPEKAQMEFKIAEIISDQIHDLIFEGMSHKKVADSALQAMKALEEIVTSDLPDTEVLQAIKDVVITAAEKFGYAKDMEKQKCKDCDSKDECMEEIEKCIGNLPIDFIAKTG